MPTCIILKEFKFTGRVFSTYIERDVRQFVHSVRVDVRGRTADRVTPAQLGAGGGPAARTDVSEQTTRCTQQV